MTEPKRILRPRRVAPHASTSIPAEVTDWFAAGCPMRNPPWLALLPPTHGRLPEWWRRWKAENPQTRRPESAALAWLEPSR